MPRDIDFDGFQPIKKDPLLSQDDLYQKKNPIIKPQVEAFLKPIPPIVPFPTEINLEKDYRAAERDYNVGGGELYYYEG